MQLVRPFLKWPGGKFRLLDRILPKFPKGKCLVEPFVGSGSVFLNATFESFCLYDNNPDLIGIFQTLQKEGEDFIERCRTFFTPYYNTSEAYYNLRNIFNLSKDIIERATLFLYLNRHAFNGLIRYNSSGLYNVPFGRYNVPYFPQNEMQAFLKKVKSVNVTFKICDFREAFSNVRLGDIVYCDPPYLPLSTTANFTTYSGSIFRYNDQKDLTELAINVSKKGIPVVLSNHNTPITRELYSTARIDYFNVQRFISCKGEKREVAPELVAMYNNI